MRLRVVLAAALAAGAARGEDPQPRRTTAPPVVAEPPAAADPRLFAPPQVDDTPTPFACTAATLASGATCVFDSTAPASADPARQAVENAQSAARLADALCRSAARHPQDPIADPDVLAACKRAFAERAMGCGADGTRAVLDAEGRFSSESRLCYAALSEVLSRAQTTARVSAPCCRCLVAARCSPSGERCNADGLSRLLDGAAARCAAERCGDVCRAYVASPATPAAPTAPAAIAAPPPGPDVWQHRNDCDGAPGRRCRAAQESRP